MARNEKKVPCPICRRGTMTVRPLGGGALAFDCSNGRCRVKNVVGLENLREQARVDRIWPEDCPICRTKDGLRSKALFTVDHKLVYQCEYCGSNGTIDWLKHTGGNADAQAWRRRLAAEGRLPPDRFQQIITPATRRYRPTEVERGREAKAAFQGAVERGREAREHIPAPGGGMTEEEMEEYREWHKEAMKPAGPRLVRRKRRLRETMPGGGGPRRRRAPTPRRRDIDIRPEDIRKTMPVTIEEPEPRSGRVVRPGRIRGPARPPSDQEYERIIEKLNEMTEKVSEFGEDIEENPPTTPESRRDKRKEFQGMMTELENLRERIHDYRRRVA
ncbi:MAG: hypothetical protein V3V26_02000 [Candidatus Aenigmarchaeota archaeon]